MQVPGENLFVLIAAPQRGENDKKPRRDFGGKKCRNGKLTAKLFGVHTMTENTCYVDFYRGHKMLQRSFLRTADAEIGRCMVQIDRMEWVDEKTVAVYKYNNTEVYYATLEEDNL